MFITRKVCLHCVSACWRRRFPNVLYFCGYDWSKRDAHVWLYDIEKQPNSHTCEDTHIFFTNSINFPFSSSLISGTSKFSVFFGILSTLPLLPFFPVPLFTLFFILVCWLISILLPRTFILAHTRSACFLLAVDIFLFDFKAEFCLLPSFRSANRTFRFFESFN